MRILAVRVHRQQSGLCEQPPTPIAWLQFHRAQMVARQLRQLVVAGQTVVDHRIIGLQKIGHRPVAPQHLGEECHRLLLHGLHQQRVKSPVCAGIDPQKIQQLQSQPLPREVLGQALGLRVGQHALGLPLKHFRIPQPALLGQTQQLGIRLAAPNEKRKPAGQFVVRDAFVVGLPVADEIQELGRG